MKDVWREGKFVSFEARIIHNYTILDGKGVDVPKGTRFEIWMSAIGDVAIDAFSGDDFVYAWRGSWNSVAGAQELYDVIEYDPHTKRVHDYQTRGIPDRPRFIIPILEPLGQKGYLIACALGGYRQITFLGPAGRVQEYAERVAKGRVTDMREEAGDPVYTIETLRQDSRMQKNPETGNLDNIAAIMDIHEVNSRKGNLVAKIRKHRNHGETAWSTKLEARFGSITFYDVNRREQKEFIQKHFRTISERGNR